MTTAADALGILDAIRAAPDDDLPRLAMADLWEEQGQAERAEFVRVQLEIAPLEKTSGRPAGGLGLSGWLLARHRDAKVLAAFQGDKGPCRCERCLRKREQELLMPSYGPPHTKPWWEWVGSARNLIPEGALYTDHVTFRRGFVESVRCTLDAWCGRPCFCKGRKWNQPKPCHRCHGTLREGAHGPAVVRAHPVARCEIAGAEMGWQPPSRRVWRRESPHWLPGAGGILPRGVFARLRGGRGVDDHSRAYDGEPEALEDLYQAALAWAKARLTPRRPGGPRTFADANDAVDAFYDGTYS